MPPLKAEASPGVGVSSLIKLRTLAKNVTTEEGNQLTAFLTYKGETLTTKVLDSPENVFARRCRIFLFRLPGPVFHSEIALIEQTCYFDLGLYISTSSGIDNAMLYYNY